MAAVTSIRWVTKAFRELSIDELYAVLRLRSEVFVVEQNCVFLDMDNNDQVAYHVMGWVDNELAATSRLYNVGQSYPEHNSIGRIVTSPKFRGNGIGRQLVSYSVDQCEKLNGKGSIKIGAQQYLMKFYSSFGFVSQEDFYVEDGIPHVHMIRP